MQNIPFEVVIGLKREGLEYFDDLPQLEKHPGPYRIKEVEVQFNKHHILGVEFKYLDKDNKEHTGHNITKFKPFDSIFGDVHKGTFKINDDDELLEVHGFVGARLNKLGFKTYKGQHHAYGVEEGEFFSHSFPGHTFGAAAGGYEKNLDFLVLRVHHLPEHRHHLKLLVVKE